MKVEKLSHAKSCELWEFFKANLPPSLRATNQDDGYGHVWGIEVKRRDSFVGYLPCTNGIATVWDDVVELRHPEYFSDFEDLCKRYERQTGREVTLRYWEAA